MQYFNQYGHDEGGYDVDVHTIVKLSENRNTGGVQNSIDRGNNSHWLYQKFIIGGCKIKSEICVFENHTYVHDSQIFPESINIKLIFVWVKKTNE